MNIKIKTTLQLLVFILSFSRDSRRTNISRRLKHDVCHIDFPFNYICMPAMKTHQRPDPICDSRLSSLVGPEMLGFVFVFFFCKKQFCSIAGKLKISHFFFGVRFLVFLSSPETCTSYINPCSDNCGEKKGGTEYHKTWFSFYPVLLVIVVNNNWKTDKLIGLTCSTD